MHQLPIIMKRLHTRHTALQWQSLCCTSANSQAALHTLTDLRWILSKSSAGARGILAQCLVLLCYNYLVSVLYYDHQSQCCMIMHSQWLKKHGSPVEGSSCPVEGSACPAEGPICPLEGSACPVEGSICPVEGSASPVEGSALPSRGPILQV